MTTIRGELPGGAEVDVTGDGDGDWRVVAAGVVAAAWHPVRRTAKRGKIRRTNVPNGAPPDTVSLFNG
jgi:hypothetical protein